MTHRQVYDPRFGQKALSVYSTDALVLSTDSPATNESEQVFLNATTISLVVATEPSSSDNAMHDHGVFFNKPLAYQ